MLLYGTAVGLEPISSLLESAILPIELSPHMAGVSGFEPLDTGVKVPGLTAWRYPYNLAERVRFELTSPLEGCLVSSAVHLTMLCHLSILNAVLP